MRRLVSRVGNGHGERRVYKRLKVRGVGADERAGAGMSAYVGVCGSGPGRARWWAGHRGVEWPASRLVRVWVRW